MISCSLAPWLLVGSLLALKESEAFVTSGAAAPRRALQLAATSSSSSSNSDASSSSYSDLEFDFSPNVKAQDWRAFRAHMIKRSVQEGLAIDTHRAWKGDRWAHELGLVEKGCLLLAHETLQGVFSQTAVLIMEHDDATGTLGLILNKPTKRRIAGVPGLGRDLQHAFGDCSVYYGGPVGAGGITALHGVQQAQGAAEIAPHVYVGGFDSLVELAQQGEVDASSLRLLHGHAAWGPGQLARELKADLWYVASASPQLITAPTRRSNSSTNTTSKKAVPLWNQILELMGGAYAEVSRRNRST